MTTIRQEDFIQSVRNALQYISYYHPIDFVRAMHAAYEQEQSAAARDAIAQILVNSRMCAEGHRPICQDTGIVTVFLEIGMGVQWESDLSVEDMVNEAVRRAYLDPDNPLRASIVADPAGKRSNTRDNTPAVVHVELVPGDTVDVRLAAKGGGSENKSKFVMLNPSDSIVDCSRSVSRSRLCIAASASSPAFARTRCLAHQSIVKTASASPMSRRMAKRRYSASPWAGSPR